MVWLPRVHWSDECLSLAPDVIQDAFLLVLRNLGVWEDVGRASALEPHVQELWGEKANGWRQVESPPQVAKACREMLMVEGHFLDPSVLIPPFLEVARWSEFVPPAFEEPLELEVIGDLPEGLGGCELLEVLDELDVLAGALEGAS